MQTSWISAPSVCERHQSPKLCRCCFDFSTQKRIELRAALFSERSFSLVFVYIKRSFSYALARFYIAYQCNVAFLFHQVYLWVYCAPLSYYSYSRRPRSGTINGLQFFAHDEMSFVRHFFGVCHTVGSPHKKASRCGRTLSCAHKNYEKMREILLKIYAFRKYYEFTITC